MRKRGGHKRALGTRAPMAIPQGPNQRWSLDFVSDSLVHGRRFRILCVRDDFSRECLAAVVDTSPTGHRVARELDRIAEMRGLPCMVLSDNGTESTSNAILRWQEERVEWHYIPPGKPMQNGFVESFNGRRGVEVDHAGQILAAPWPVIAGQGPEISGLCRPAPRIQHRSGGVLRGLRGPTGATVLCELHEQLAGSLQLFGQPRLRR